MRYGRGNEDGFWKFFEQIPASFVRPFLSYVTLIDQNFEFA